MIPGIIYGFNSRAMYCTTCSQVTSDVGHRTDQARAAAEAPAADALALARAERLADARGDGGGGGGGDGDAPRLRARVGELRLELAARRLVAALAAARGAALCVAWLRLRARAAPVVRVLSDDARALVGVLRAGHERLEERLGEAARQSSTRRTRAFRRAELEVPAREGREASSDNAGCA